MAARQTTATTVETLAENSALAMFRGVQPLTSDREGAGEHFASVRKMVGRLGSDGEAGENHDGFTTSCRREI